MSEAELLSALRDWRRPEEGSLDEAIRRNPEEIWGRMCDVARGHAPAFDDAVLERIEREFDAHPRGVLAVLIGVAGRDPGRAPAICARFRDLMARRPADGLAIAGYWLYEYGPALQGAEWVAAARGWYEANPEGAWGVAASAARHAPAAMTPAQVDWFEERIEGAPRYYFEAMLDLANNDAVRAPDLLDRVLARFDRFPAEAVEAACACARGEKDLLRRDLLEAVLRHLGANLEKGWEFFEGAARARPEAFDEVLLDALEARAAARPAGWFDVLRGLILNDAERAPRLLDRLVRGIPAHPAEAVDTAYTMVVNDAHLLRQDFVDAVAAAFPPKAAYHAYDILHVALLKRPELLHARHVEAAVRAIPHATNWAFGFFRAVLESRPEFTPLCTVALFDCLALEPVNRAQTRIEELQQIVAVAQASHVRTELERVLREPPATGSRRARALMAILFRQRSRSRQHVLFEALRFAATACTWSDRNWTPLWDFFLLLLDHSSDDAVSTAAAERFLEGAWQLKFLMERGADHDAFRSKFELREAPPVPWPAAAGFLARDGELTRLYRVTLSLARRCGVEPKIAPLGEFERRAQDAEIELQAIEDRIGTAEGPRRARLEERRRTLNRHLAWWISPAWAEALKNPAAEARLAPEARDFLARERRDLGKHVRDALRAELARIAVQAVEGERTGLYRAKLKAVLGRDVEVGRLDAKILPSLLFFPALQGFPKNRKWLARLIEDRIERRPHDWMWTEPEALAWKEQVAAAQPGVVFERWRAPFRRECQYQPGDAEAERKRRIRDDLAQARKLLEQEGAEGIRDSSPEELARALAALREKARRPAAEEGEGESKAPAEPPPDAEVLREVEMNLERVRIVSETPASDYRGRLTIEVETDPFEVLFMGEYGFASCLSLRGVNVWSAVSNAVDVDKAILWARDPGGNVVGRRLIALTPGGVLSYRTYANRHGLSLDRMFDEVIAGYAAHCGVPVTHGGHPGPLLSDRWYDDGAI